MRCRNAAVATLAAAQLLHDAAHAFSSARRLKMLPLRRPVSACVSMHSPELTEGLAAAVALIAEGSKEVPGLGVRAVPQNTYVPPETIDNFPQIVAGSLAGVLVYLWAAYEFGSVSSSVIDACSNLLSVYPRSLLAQAIARRTLTSFINAVARRKLMPLPMQCSDCCCNGCLVLVSH